MQACLAGAVFVDWTKDITEAPLPGAPPVQLADEARFTSAMEVCPNEPLWGQPRGKSKVNFPQMPPLGGSI